MRKKKSQDEEKILCENIRGTIPMLRTLIEKGFVISQGDKIYQKLSKAREKTKRNVQLRRGGYINHNGITQNGCCYDAGKDKSARRE